MGTTWTTRLGVAGLLLAAAGSGRADMPVPPPMPPGPRPVPVTATIDFGPLAANIGERYVVQPRDTLRAVARRFSADAGAWKAIAAANRATLPDPDRLRVGDVLWIPPKDRLATPAAGKVVPAAAPPTDYALFWVVRRGTDEVVRQARGLKIPEGVPPGSFTVCLVPATSAAALLRLEDGAARPLGSTAAVPGAATLTVPWPAAEPIGGDPAARIEVQVKVKGVAGSAIDAATDVVRLGSDGAVMAQTPRADAPAPEPAPVPIARTRTPAPSEAPGPDLPPPPAAPAPGTGRFPVLIGVLVALAGAFLVVLAWLLKTKPPAPPTA